MSKCQEELNYIPEVAAWFKARSRESEQAQGHPLEGMEIVLTIDRMVRAKIDTEAAANDWCYKESTVENFDKIVAALKQNEMPPTVNFLIGRSLDPEFQEAWLRSGNLLGNMTFSRKKPKKTTVEEFIEDVEMNDQALAPIIAKHEQARKYFRYPGFTLAPDPQKLARISGYLKQKGYSVVPATIDAKDAMFAQSYCAALSRGDSTCANFIKTTFKSILLDKTLKAREAARRIAGRDVKHILVMEANQLTCDMLGELLGWYKALGARFISIDEALGDQFYTAESASVLANQIISETERAQIAGE